MKAVNLLPQDLRGAHKASRAPAAQRPEPVGGVGAFVVLGALAFSVVALAAYVLAGNTVKDREAELARVTSESQVAVAKAAQLKPYADFEAKAAARVATVSQLVESRFDWERSLRDLSRALPDDVTLTSIDGSVSAESGGSGSSLRGAVSAPAVSLAGCTDSQPAVARLMARLRAVQGVTRVSLAKADKEANATSAGAATPGSTLGGGCGKGNPPVFDIVVFFEGSKAVAGSTTTAPAAATEQAGAAGGSTATTTPTSTSANGAATPEAPAPETQGGVTP